LLQQLHEQLQGEPIPLNPVLDIDTPLDSFSDGSQMEITNEAQNVALASSRALKTFFAHP
jgi:hypothetical protein